MLLRCVLSRQKGDDIMFSPRIAADIPAFRDIETLKKDYFSSFFGMISDADDPDVYDMFLRSQRWWLHLQKPKGLLDFFFYQYWRVPADLLRFSNALFLANEDMKEIQVVWDTAVMGYYLKKEGCHDTTDDNQMPIARLFKEYPEKEPNGIWGVCKRPAHKNDPYDFYGIDMYAKLGRVIDHISEFRVFN